MWLQPRCTDFPFSGCSLILDPLSQKLHQHVLIPCYSKFVPQTGSMGTSLELTRNADFQLSSQAYWIRICIFTEFSGNFCAHWSWKSNASEHCCPIKTYYVLQAILSFLLVMKKGKKKQVKLVLLLIIDFSLKYWTCYFNICQCKKLLRETLYSFFIQVIETWCVWYVTHLS